MAQPTVNCRRMEKFDFVVIGGGSAGYSAAATAARSGLKTVCIEGGKEVGGLCILRGCMPSKTFIESANRFLTLRRAKEFGLSAGHLAFDSGAIVQRKRDLIAEFAKHRVQQLTEGEFEFVRGRAEFADSHHLKVKLMSGGEKEIEGKTFLISTGSVLNFIDLPGLDEAGFLDSDTALDCERFPRSVVILGGGAVALEFAHFYNALGLEVTVLQRSNQVIKEADPGYCRGGGDSVSEAWNPGDLWHETDASGTNCEREKRLVRTKRRRRGCRGGRDFLRTWAQACRPGARSGKSGSRNRQTEGGGGERSAANIAAAYLCGRGRDRALRNCAHRDPARRDCGPEREAITGRQSA